MDILESLREGHEFATKTVVGSERAMKALIDTACIAPEVEDGEIVLQTTNYVGVEL